MQQPILRVEVIERRAEDAKRANLWRGGYIIDWIIPILGMLTIYYLVVFVLNPVRRFLPPDFLDDPSIGFPLKPETVTLWMLALLPIVHIIAIIVTQFFLFSWWDIHHAVLGFFIAFFLSQLVTQPLKLLIGAYRPNFIAFCDPDPITFKCQNEGVFGENRSFPSGHTSKAFAMIVFSVLYLCGKLRLFRSDGSASPLKVAIALSPLVIAGLVGVSRVRDYYHTVSDVVAGALIGIVSAIVSYGVYYHALWSDKSEMPRVRFGGLKNEDVSFKSVVISLL